MTGFEIAAYEVQKRITCSTFCSLNPQCRSYNFCGDRICQINQQDEFIYEYSTVTSYIVNDNCCEFVQLHKQQFPECNSPSIEEKSHSDFCGRLGIDGVPG